MVVDAALESANDHETMRELFAHVEKVPHLDVDEEWVKAAVAVQALQLESLDEKYLVDLRAKFQKLAHKLRHKYTEADMRREFQHVCLRKPGTPHSFIRFILRDLASCSSWEELWEGIHKQVQEAILYRDVRRMGSPAWKVSLSPYSRKSLMKLMGQVEMAVDEDWDSSEDENDGVDEEVDEQLACSHVAVPPPAGGMRRPLPQDTGPLGNLLWACHTCGDQGHFFAECKALNKDTGEVTMPAARAKALFRAARCWLTLQDTLRADG